MNSLMHCQAHLQYNGCKWLGGILRVEPAKPDYRQRLAKEVDQDAAQEADKDLQASEPSAVPHSSGPIHLASKDGRKVSFRLLAIYLVGSVPPISMDCPQGHSHHFVNHNRVKKIPKSLFGQQSNIQADSACRCMR